jgi:hypothetical protein
VNSSAYNLGAIKWSTTRPDLLPMATGSKRLHKMIKKALKDDKNGKTEKFP